MLQISAGPLFHLALGSDCSKTSPPPQTACLKNWRREMPLSCPVTQGGMLQEGWGCLRLPGWAVFVQASVALGVGDLSRRP
jgi:hypothetical protein